MAVKVILLLTLAAAVKSQESNDICDCDMNEKQKETTQLWDLLSKFATKLDGVSDEEKDLYATLPGIVSPLLRCDCLENNRKKRKIFPEPTDAVEVEGTIEEEAEQQENKSVQFHDRRCPSGFARVGIYCIALDKLE